MELSQPTFVPSGFKRLGLALSLGLAVALSPYASLAQCTVHKNPLTLFRILSAPGGTIKG
ncbi:MAG: hypothetical protein AB7S38_00250 [Vulcanimicrobiota bacterium]